MLSGNVDILVNTTVNCGSFVTPTQNITLYIHNQELKRRGIVIPPKLTHALDEYALWMDYSSLTNDCRILYVKNYKNPTTEIRWNIDHLKDIINNMKKNGIFFNY
jgi:hypothetical protein